MTKLDEQPGGTIYLDGLVAGDRPSLARFTDVSALVRQFAAGVFAVRVGFDAGHADAKEPLALIEKEARRCGAIILGEDTAVFDPQAWNTPRRLGVTLRALLPDESRHYGDSGTALFMWLANQLLHVSKAHTDGRLTERAAKQEIEALCNDVTGRILGLGGA